MEIRHCPTCKHVYWATEAHECPTPEYIAARDALVTQAANGDPGERQESRLHWDLEYGVPPPAYLTSLWHRD